jgi:hypothetical protein
MQFAYCTTCPLQQQIVPSSCSSRLCHSMRLSGVVSGLGGELAKFLPVIYITSAKIICPFCFVLRYFVPHCNICDWQMDPTPGGSSITPGKSNGTTKKLNQTVVVHGGAADVRRGLASRGMPPAFYGVAGPKFSVPAVSALVFFCRKMPVIRKRAP